MSEALYYLVATLAVWALAACLERPTLVRQSLLLGAVALAFGTRLQAVGLAGTILLALALVAVAERSLAPFRRLLPTLGVLGAGAVLWAAARVRAGGLGELLGAYAPLIEADDYSLGDIAQSLAWQTGAVALITVAVPLVALGILAWELLRGREEDPRVRALVASALAYAAVTLVVVGAFASRFVEHVTERQLLSVAPPIFVVFAVWLHRGAPRPQPATSIVAFAVAAAALLLPLDRVTTPAAYADSPSMISLEQLSRHLDEAPFEGVYAGALALLLLAAVLLPRRAVPGLAIVVALALAGGSLIASTEVRDRSQTERERTFAGAPVDWIDAAGERDVALLLTGERFWPSAWEVLFWNESIRSVVRLRGVDSPGVVPQEVATIGRDGVLEARSGVDLEPPVIAAPTGTSIVGEEIASLPASFEQVGMALWRVEPPLRVSRRITGLRPNGDLHGDEAARIEVFGCGPGELQLTLLGKQGLPTRIRLGGSDPRRARDSAGSRLEGRGAGARERGWDGPLRLRARNRRTRRIDEDRLRSRRLSRARAGAHELGLSALGERDRHEVEVARYDRRREQLGRLFDDLVTEVARRHVRERKELHARFAGDERRLAGGRVAGLARPLALVGEKRRLVHEQIRAGRGIDHRP